MQNSSIINDLRLVSQSDGICCSAAIHLYFVPFSVSLLVLMKRQAHCLIFSRAVEIKNKLLSKQIIQKRFNCFETNGNIRQSLRSENGNFWKSSSIHWLPRSIFANCVVLTIIFVTKRMVLNVSNYYLNQILTFDLSKDQILIMML